MTGPPRGGPSLLGLTFLRLKKCKHYVSSWEKTRGGSSVLERAASPSRPSAALTGRRATTPIFVRQIDRCPLKVEATRSNRVGCATSFKNNRVIGFRPCSTLISEGLEQKTKWGCPPPYSIKSRHPRLRPASPSGARFPPSQANLQPARDRKCETFHLSSVDYHSTFKMVKSRGINGRCTQVRPSAGTALKGTG